jgi:hypothetical protein
MTIKKSLRYSLFLMRWGMPSLKDSLGWELEKEGGLGGFALKRRMLKTNTPPIKISCIYISLSNDSFGLCLSNINTDIKVPIAPEIAFEKVSAVVTATL